MSAGDVYLQIVEDDKGRPIMHFNGREFGVLEEPADPSVRQGWSIIMAGLGSSSTPCPTASTAEREPTSASASGRS
ncbi:hypothetical protein SEA_ANNYONG_38 [Mycobacterium phage Annyong]|uniref:Uncharacterized protein n=1 Tax=Mycobacterium phage Annyong TaxID=2126945 RepID=A0A2R4AMS5_9CAUD|nr:hypothetical protein SEA_ANNYONG_38 [Mycobacterium phage Annyong]